jgi:hypothetical protein
LANRERKRVLYLTGREQDFIMFQEV